MLEVGAVIFDMDGVLIDSEPLYMEQERRSFARYGISLDTPELARFVGTTQAYMWSAIKHEYGLTESLDLLMAQHQQQVVRSMSAVPLLAMAGTQPLLAALKSAGVLCAVASSSPRELVNVVLRETGLRSYFDEVICGDDVKQSKPNPEIFLLSAKKLGLRPEQCVVIEDSCHGVAAAKAATMFCIGLINANSGQQDLSRADIRVYGHDEILEWFSEI